MVHENRKEEGLSPEGEAMLILKKKLESYQSLVENMPDPIARFNRELQFVYANQAFLKNMGLPASAILGKTSRDFEFPESMAIPATSLLQKVFETGEAAEMQTYFPLDDGDIYMLTKIVPEWNEHGAVETVLAIGCDMTNEKKAEQEILRLREEVAQKTTDKYQAILNSIDDGFVFCQLLRNEQGEAIDYRYLDFNAAFQKQRGLPVDYFAGRTVREVYPGNHRPSLEIYEKAVNTNQPVRTEIFHSDNWYELTAYPFKEDYFSVIFRNIDQRKKTEQQLAEAEKTYKLQLEQEVAERTFELSESQHQYASLVENTPDVITRWDKDLKLIFANSAFASKTGIDLEELHGKTNLEMGLPQEIAISYMNSLQKVFETGQPLEHFHAFPTPHGEVYYFSRIVPEKNEQGEVQTVLRIARDITHIKKTEEEILGLKDEVAQKATDKYMTLFNTMEEGFLVIELIRDEAGKCIDYRFLEVNPAFEKLIGIKPADALGRTVLEIFPTLDPWWLEMYGEIGAKGESTRFEQHLKENDRWYESFVYPTMWDQQLAVLYKDITERKRHEQSQALLSTISKELVELTTIDETVQRLGEKIGQHFGVSWCMFAEIDQEHPVTTYGWNVEEVASIKGTYRVRDYLSAEQVANNNAGIQSIVRDTELEPHSSAESVKKLGIRSFIGTPLVRNQKWCFTLSIMHTEPRQWREDEIELIQEIASRIWTRLERAHAEEELRINKERTQAQKEAFQATINGASLEESLNILARMVTVELGSKVQTAFFLASPDNVHLLAIHGAGDMIDSYKKQIDGFPIGLHSFGCGLAMATGQPVLTPDIYAEPLWHNHIALAEEGSFRAVGSFPIKTREGTQVGTFAMYFSDIQEFTSQILTLADAVTQAAAFILSHNAEVQERARVEAALRQSEERLIITMESATDYAIITTDPDGIIERWSGGASKIFLYSEEEAKGKPINIIFTEEDRDAGISQKEMAVARNLGHATHGRWHQRKDGTRFFVSGVMRPIYNPTLTGYVKVVRDATQEQLFTEELHRLVAERTDELQRSNEDLRQFAHVASHDLKEPVRKIKIFQNRITDEYSDTLPEKVKVYLSKMENATDRMFSMIEGVLKYSKLGDSEQTEEWVNLNEVIGDISTDLELLMQQKNARLHTNNLPVLTGFKVLLYQLFYNLILNSLKFSKAGVPAQIEINAEEVMEDNQPFYKIIVSDNGIGFEATNAEKIFITFTKLNPANEYEGTGLGLALCKKIVLRHGGTISATGVPNQGATFTILLPAR